MILVGLCLPALASAIPKVYIDPPVSYVDVNEEFDVQVMISAEADTFSNFQVFLEFDPGLLELVEVFEGSLYTESGLQTWFEWEEESAGLWEIFDVIFPAMSFVIAPGELAKVRFRALADGTSPLHFVSVAVKDIYRYPLLPLMWDDGIVHVGPVVGVGAEPLPALSWQLGPPVPNPSPGATRISLTGPLAVPAGAFGVAVFDARGRLIRQLTDTFPAGGATSLLWDGQDSGGAAVPSGVYFFRLETPGETVSRRVVLVR